ncbi:hypothetical protein XELAEV_18024132mg [Xenopus laevis]|uniref:Helix-turn-helix domain-containing protein n=1 Tax=Xenopus laevis TaxID=8355 RepID=A0A974D7X0_XENLA|nr:hypothetical protein XELAEV_18024132mg [Xenopus laevis]
MEQQHERNSYKITIYQLILSHIHFLDTTIYIIDNTLHTTIYRKPTDKPSYLMYDSFHPDHMKHAIIYSQVLRYNRICSDTSERDQHLETLRKDFIDRGYNPRVIDHNIHRATKVSRSQLLKYKQKRETNRVPLVTTYNPQLKALRKVARELQVTLQKDKRLHTIFPDPPLLVFRQPPNLQKLIIRSSLSGPTNNGTHPCGRKRCKTCPHILSTDRVQIPGTIEEYYIHGHYTCSSSNVCPTRGIYIGETGKSFRKRTNHHRFTINNKKLDTPVGEHFNSPNHSLGDFLSSKAISKQKMNE